MSTPSSSSTTKAPETQSGHAEAHGEVHHFAADDCQDQTRRPRSRLLNGTVSEESTTLKVTRHVGHRNKAVPSCLSPGPVVTMPQPELEHLHVRHAQQRTNMGGVQMHARTVWGRPRPPTHDRESANSRTKVVVRSWWPSLAASKQYVPGSTTDSQ